MRVPLISKSPAPRGPIHAVLVDRIRMAVYILIAATLLFAAFDLATWRGAIPAVHAIQLVVLAFAALALFALERIQHAWQLHAIGVSALSVGCGGSAVIALLTGNDATTPVLAVAGALACATTIPWGGRTQSIAALAAAACIVVSSTVPGDDGDFLSTSEMAALFIVLVASVAIAAAMQRERDTSAAAEARRQSVEGRFQTLAETTDAVPWESDFHTFEFTYVGPQAERLLGFPVSDWYRPTFWSDQIHPDDRSWATQYCVEESKRRKSYEFEYRMITADRRVVWVHDSVAVIHDENGPRWLRGFLFDVTTRRRAEQVKSSLLSLARDIGDAVERSSILGKVCRHVTEAVGCDAAVIFDWCEAEQLFRIVAHFGLPELAGDFIPQARFARDAAFPEAGDWKTVLVNRPEDAPKLPWATLTAAGFRRVAVTKLRVGGRDQGRLVGLRRGGIPFDEDDGALLAAITRVVAGALERAELHNTLKEDARVSAALAEISRQLMSTSGTQAVYEQLCRCAANSLGADWVYAWTRVGNDDIYEATAYHGGSREMWESVRAVRVVNVGPYADRLLAERMIMRSGEEMAEMPQGDWGLTLGVQRLVHIALAHGDRVFGCLSCSFTDLEAEWSSVHERISLGLSQIASLRIENVRLVEELEWANRVKADFVATMSHELRTPLNVILGYNDLLIDGAFGEISPEQQDVVRRVLDHSQSLLGLINQTLDVGRLESGGLTIEREHCDVRQLLAHLNAETRELQQKPGLSVHWRVADELPPLMTDPTKLKVALRNLVHNAIKFTPAGEVTIDADRIDGAIHFSVRDTGIGIPQEALNMIFDAFQQVDGSLTRKFDGVGLGLYIARQLTQLLGGNLTVESVLGRGSTFHLSVPVTPP